MNTRLFQRRISASWLLPLLMLSALPAVAQFSFTTNTDNTLTVTGYVGPDGAVAIPGMTNGLTVTSIGPWAFSANTNLAIATIPGSVKNIGKGAFCWCTSLTNIAIPDGVTNIGDQAFYCCRRLSGIRIPGSVRNIGEIAFLGCTVLTEATIGDGVSQIGQMAFCQCNGLTNVLIPASVTSLGEEAFFDCADLTSVTIGALTVGEVAFDHCTSLTNIIISNSVTCIGQDAFAGCLKLTSIAIPASVTNLNGGVGWFFADCTSLAEIEVDPLNSVYCSVEGVLYSRDRTALLRCPSARVGIYSIPDNVNTIESGAFESCRGLTNVTIPNGVSVVESHTFYQCAALTRVRIPDSVTNIEYEAFCGCIGLTSVTIPAGVVAIGYGSFGECSNLTAAYFTGDRPEFPSIGETSWLAFGADDNATVYYLPGTWGWSPPYQTPGVPVVLWNPQALSSDPSFGVLTNGFGFTITGTTNIPIVVEACTDLANSAWSPLQTCTLTNGSLYFSDPQWTNYPARFYRFRSP